MDENQNNAALDETTPPDTGNEGTPAVNADNAVQANTSSDTEAHRENSRLGRKVVRLEETITELSEQIRTFLNQSGGKVNNQVADDPEYISTADDVRRIMQREKQAEESKLTAYQTDYKRTLNTLGVDDPIREEVIAEMFSNNYNGPFNKVQTGFGNADARINFSDARAAVIAKKHATPTPNVKGESGVPAGLGVSGQSAASATKTPIQLDPTAEKFAKTMGMTDEQVRNALR